MEKKKVYIVGESINYANFVNNFELTNYIETADIIIFTGGEDVNPSLYGQKVGHSTYYNSKRDTKEIAEWERAKKCDALKIGICRGSQLLTVLNGGELIQDVKRHGVFGGHNIVITNNNINEKATEVKNLIITSTHHQMMYPFNMNKKDYMILAYAEDRSKGHYLNGDNKNIDLPKDFVEPEIVYYPKYKTLCIQGHPEGMSRFNQEELLTINYINNLINILR